MFDLIAQVGSVGDKLDNTDKLVSIGFTVIGSSFFTKILDADRSYEGTILAFLLVRTFLEIVVVYLLSSDSRTVVVYIIARITQMAIYRGLARPFMEDAGWDSEGAFLVAFFACLAYILVFMTIFA